MCHTVTHEPDDAHCRDAPAALGRPRGRRRPARGRARARGAGLRAAGPAGGRGRHPARAGPRRPTARRAAGDRRRRARPHRRPDPHPAHPRQVDHRPAARPGRRPDRRAGRRGPPRRARRGRRRAGVGGRAPRGRGPLRWRHERDRRAGGPARRLRRRRQPRPGPDEAPARRRRRLDDRDPRAGAARARGRGAAGRARPDAGPLPAVLRARVDRRLRRDPVQRPVQCGLRPLRRDGRRADRRNADGLARPRLLAGQRRRPRPAPAAARLGGRLRRHHVGDRATCDAPPPSRRTRGGAGRRSTRGPTRCAPWPRPGCCRP